MGMRIYSDVAIDDFSLSPECFGLNIPIDALGGYNYYDAQLSSDKPPHRDFVNRTSKLCFFTPLVNIHDFNIYLNFRTQVITCPHVEPEARKDHAPISA